MLLLLLLLLLLLCVAVTLGPVPHGGVSQGGQQLETYCKSKQLKTKFTNYSTLFRKFCLMQTFIRIEIQFCSIIHIRKKGLSIRPYNKRPFGYIYLLLLLTSSDCGMLRGGRDRCVPVFA